MSSRDPTPFIPPLSIEASPQPPTPPQLTQPPGPNHQNWPQPPAAPVNHPFYPSPYAGTPFLPPAFMPGTYAPAPAHLPPIGGPHQPRPPTDWHGFDPFPGHPAAGPTRPSQWGNNWPAPPTAYTTFTHPLSPVEGVFPGNATPATGWIPPLPGSAFNTPPLGVGQPVYGLNGGPSGLSPVQPPYGLNDAPSVLPPVQPPYGLNGPPSVLPPVQPPYGFGGPGQPTVGRGVSMTNHPGCPEVGLGFGMPGQPGPRPPIVPRMQGPSSRRPGNEDCPIRPFAAGPHYGPVLDMMTLHIVKAQLLINPLLRPPPDDDSHAVLEWNMLFPSRACRRSTDSSNVSWIVGRNEPATFPRVNELRLFARTLPWEVKITAQKDGIGVTCADVIEGLDNYLHRTAGRTEFNAQPAARQREISQSYYANRSTAEGAPGGALGAATLRLDWLCERPMFGGLVKNDAYAKQMYGAAVPNLFEWKCVPKYMRMEDEGLAGRMRELDLQNGREGEEEGRKEGSPGTQTLSSSPGFGPSNGVHEMRAHERAAHMEEQQEGHQREGARHRRQSQSQRMERPLKGDEDRRAHLQREQMNEREAEAAYARGREHRRSMMEGSDRDAHENTGYKSSVSSYVARWHGEQERRVRFPHQGRAKDDTSTPSDIPHAILV